MGSAFFLISLIIDLVAVFIMQGNGAFAFGLKVVAACVLGAKEITVFLARFAPFDYNLGIIARLSTNLYLLVFIVIGIICSEWLVVLLAIVSAIFTYSALKKL